MKHTQITPQNQTVSTDRPGILENPLLPVNRGHNPPETLHAGRRVFEDVFCQYSMETPVSF